MIPGLGQAWAASGRAGVVDAVADNGAVATAVEVPAVLLATFRGTVLPRSLTGSAYK